MPRPRDHPDRILEAVERRRLKTEYRDLFVDLTAFFFEVDPMGINFEVNPDEYEPEVGTILPRVFDTEAATEIVPIIREEFERWFGQGIRVELASYEEIAEGVLEILKRYRCQSRDEAMIEHTTTNGR
jgi:hypothetical protein